MGLNKRSRIAVGLAGIGVAALALAGCTTSAPTPGSSSSAPAATGGTVTVAEVNEFTSLNSNTPDGNLDTNGFVTYLDSAGFNYIDDKLQTIPDEKFGTVEKLSDDPLTVKYTINPDQKWSDGEPITADDMLLAYAIYSGYYDDATLNANGKVKSGNSYFSYAGDTSGLALADFPEVSDDNQSVTLTYTKPYADWSYVGLLDKPLHILAKKAGVSEEDAVAALKDTPRGDPANPAPTKNAIIGAMADFWNTGYDVTSMPTDPDLLVTSGAFTLTDYQPTQSLTMTANPNYTGGLPAKIDSIVIRFIPDANAQVTALQNGEVDVISPQASADTLSALDALPDATTLLGDQFFYDHIDLTFNEGPFQDPKVREAFLKTIPRQQILEAIVTPINDKAKVLDSQIFVPTVGQAYTDSIAQNDSSNYANVDIEGAKALLDGATPTIKILYNSDNPNRVDAFQAISASAEQAGFKIVDGGDPNWGSLLGNGGYDASIFGWSTSGVGVSGVSQLFSTGGGGNYNGYSNPEVDQLASTLNETTDAATQVSLEQQIDKHLFDDAYGLPLFQSPGITAYSSAVSGITAYPGQTGVFWNYFDWTVNS